MSEHSADERLKAVPSCLPSVVLTLVLTLLPGVIALSWGDDRDRESPPATAMQTPYRNGVPHTDAHGARRSQYDGARSFFPIGLYHTLSGRHFGRDHDLALIQKAGFNTIHTWEGLPAAEAATAAHAAGLALILHNPSEADVRLLSGRPELLAWYLDEEPSLHLAPEAQSAALASFLARAEHLRQLDSAHPILMIDYPAFLGSRRAAWMAWADAGDVSAHDNYPLRAQRTETLDSALGIARSVTLAVRATRQHKPLWLVVQAMASPVHDWRMPEPDELRAMVYTGLIHGATGILYFALDSFVTREGGIVGIAPDPPAGYGPTPGFGRQAVASLTAGEAEREASRRLWSAVVALNAELSALAPALLSPTSRASCGVVVSGASVSPQPIRILLKDGPEGLVLLAVNLDRRPLEVAFRCEQARKEAVIDKVTRSFESTSAPIQSSFGGWQDSFAPLAVHVYNLKSSTLAAESR